MSVCVTCGLPKELCVCETIAKESQLIEIRSERRKFGKQYTVITGIDSKEIDLDAMAKKLKNQLACGGTAKEGQIELQGKHMAKVKEVLVKMGFAPETIVVKEAKWQPRHRR